MNFYEAVLKYKKAEFDLPFATEEEKEDDSKRHYQMLAGEINGELGIKCDLDRAFSVLAWEAKENEIKLIFAVDTDKSTLEKCIDFMKKYFVVRFIAYEVNLTDIVEISTERFHQLGERGDNNGFIKRYRADESELKINYHENRQYEIREEVIKEETLSKDEAYARAKDIMADKSLYEELDRIYSDENEKKYYGNPVHYKISASSLESAYNIADLLAEALKANSRLLGSRINKIYDISECCYEEDDFKNMFEVNHGNIVMLDLSGNSGSHGNYASAYEDVVNYVDQLISKNHVKTLCFFIENTEHPGFSKIMLSRVAESIDIIEIKEGCGTREEALDFIENLVKKNGYTATKSELEEMLPDKKILTVGETYGVYNNWFKNGLRNRIYRSYKACNTMEVRSEDKSSEPYNDLKAMIGLAEIKKVTDEVIDSARIQKLRSDMGMDSYKTSLHMVFTGNPGSAKTTVARLLAQIFAKEGILSSGKYVECGRADLVGKYVGWTAKTVRAKFREAQGGILFIDEAYSLVDDSNSFGDEAINTIVQEMENHRGDVIVIFAGYPEKMKNFLEKNEGLRSRIAFHLDFPDYNADEMTDIFKLMADKKGYKYDDKVVAKCREIFEEACKKSEFGNGRFARNLLEQAMMAQARRLSKKYSGKKITRKALCILKVEDFDVNACKQIEKDMKRPIGFAG